MKKILNPYLNKEGYNCVCCAPNNPVGLHLEFWEENEDVLTIWKPGENYQGWVNTLHGGIISMLMDEVAGWVSTASCRLLVLRCNWTWSTRSLWWPPIRRLRCVVTSPGSAATSSPSTWPWRTPKARFVMRAKPSISLSDQTKPEKWASKVARLKGSNRLLFAETTTLLLWAFCGIEISTIKISFYSMLLK